MLIAQMQSLLTSAYVPYTHVGIRLAFTLSALAATHKPEKSEFSYSRWCSRYLYNPVKNVPGDAVADKFSRGGWGSSRIRCLTFG